MGDRSNVVLLLPSTIADSKDDVTPLWLYSHWGGQEFQTTALAKALQLGRNRWADPFYLTRIIITEVFADLAGGESGGGVGMYIGDNEHDVVVVDIVGNTVHTAVSEDDLTPARPKVSFEDYVAEYVPVPADADA